MGSFSHLQRLEETKTDFNNSARCGTELMQMRLESGSFPIVCVIIIHLFSNVISLKAYLALFITIYIVNSPINPLIFVLAGIIAQNHSRI